MYTSEGCRARSKAMGLGSILEGVQVFESPPSHHIRSIFRHLPKKTKFSPHKKELLE